MSSFACSVNISTSSTVTVVPTLTIPSQYSRRCTRLRTEYSIIVFNGLGKASECRTNLHWQNVLGEPDERGVCENRHHIDRVYVAKANWSEIERYSSNGACEGSSHGIMLLRFVLRIRA